MFQWYRLAVRCYAYLCDLPSQLSEEEIERVLPSCRWFSGGWTLQELLAPRELMFFAQDWTRLGERRQWVAVISAATSIHEDALTGSVEHIRAFSMAQKFSWASQRRTAREEDIAYSLLGLFNVYMPLLYGEGSQAFVRLQEKIVKKSDDQTIFVWGRDDTENNYKESFAPSPSEFVVSHDIVPFRHWKSSQPYEMTNAGLRVNASLLRTTEDSIFTLILQCYDQRATERAIEISLVQLSPDGDQFARIHGVQYSMGIGCEFLPQRTIYIKNDIIRPEAHTLSATGKLIHFHILITGRSNDHQIIHAWPPHQWDQRGQILNPPQWSNASDQRSNCPDPSLFNWSWHAALLVSSQEGRDYTSCDNKSLIVVIGYNGRNDRCWCDMYYGTSEELEDVWTMTPYPGATQIQSEASSNTDENTRTPYASISLFGPGGRPLPETITSSLNGHPLVAVIRID